jgi:AraC-like DNA-binding protein
MREAGRETWRKLLVARTSEADPLAAALAHKAASGAAGTARGTTVASGPGWRVQDIVCTSGPGDRPFEERQSAASISLVLSGTFVYRSRRGASVMSAGAMLLGNAGDPFECSHEHGDGDRCLSFQFEPELFDRLAHDAGAQSASFAQDRLPPVRPLAAVATRAALALRHDDAFEEIALDLGGAVVGMAGDARRDAPGDATRDAARIVRVLKRLEARSAEPHGLADLARVAGLSPYHFLRTFKRVTGVTPHQWVLRARLRDAARRLVETRAPITEIALDVGFEDLSNFIRTFRAEFGVSPSRYRRR